MNIYTMELEDYLYPSPDKRVVDWFCMESVYPVCIILSIYLTIVYKVGPSFMKKRKPYNLKTILAIYNLGQVLACIAFVYEIFDVEPRLVKFWQCVPVDYTDNPKSIRMLTIAYWSFWLKVAETIETVFFVLRKKQNQISILHVYHHCMTIVLTWLLTRYIGGGACLFSILLNSGVHIIMYSYYLVALLGRNIQSKLMPVKKSITIIQMLQFCILMTQALIHFIKGCFIPFFIQIIYVASISVIFYLFYDFYKTTYNKKQQRKSN